MHGTKHDENEMSYSSRISAKESLKLTFFFFFFFESDGGEKGLRNVCIELASFTFRLGRYFVPQNISVFYKISKQSCGIERSKVGSFGDFLRIFKIAYLWNGKSQSDEIFSF